jgi:DNA (cytosine-5)-methyltransferase 1
MQKHIQRKLQRLGEGAPVRVMDLFAGCGGLSLGFRRAGCELLGGVELDPEAVRSHALNFFRDAPEALREEHARPHDITATTPFELLQRWGHDPGTTAVDLLVGGPPCHAFSRVGRAKLRETLQHPEAFKIDPRARLYRNYLSFVEELQPLAIAMENVPDIMNWGGRNIAEEICAALGRMGYVCRYTLLNAAAYGVPQMRERFFLVGFHEDLDTVPAFPSPSHRVDLPEGYRRARDVATRIVRARDLATSDTRFVASPGCGPATRAAVSAREAVGDLPPIRGHLDGTLRRGRRRLDGEIPSPRPAHPSRYVREMREWPGFASNSFLRDHVTRALSDRDFRIFREMEPGAEYPRAHQIGTRLFEQELQARRALGESLRANSAAFRALKAEYVPPYDPTKFPNKWRKLDAETPVRTLMAHLGKDSYSHIHYDSAQARVISVREAARFQSFPDGFRFAGAMNAAFRQIGNAVPPLLAFALARTIVASLADAIGARSHGGRAPAAARGHTLAR